MIVKVLKSKYKPTDIAVGSARSCYYGKSIVIPEDIREWDKKNSLLNSIFKAGHHTTLMHYNFTFLIENMSRLLIWRLLHSHPFYNSEQVSQRYAKMKIENFTYPKNANKEKWQKYYEKMFFYYEEIIKRLTPEIEKILPKFKIKEARKKAQEFARYLLPVGMNAHLYHTINVITALRYINAVKVIPEAKNEADNFIFQLKREMLKIDKDLISLIEFVENEEVIFPDVNIAKIKKQKNITQKVEVFDIVDYDFELNANYAGVLRASNIYLDEAVLGSFNSYIKLSLSADAQNQRHRRSPAIRPKLETIYKRDFYIPTIIKGEGGRMKDEGRMENGEWRIENGESGVPEKSSDFLGCRERIENAIAPHTQSVCGGELKDLYLEAVEYSYDFFEKEKEVLGFGEAAYALLNAHNIEIIEHNDFQEFSHKAQMRLCYNAQEEIFDIVRTQVKELKNKKIKAAEKFLPPCALRYAEDIRPICPEGERFCGVKVWKMNFDDYNRII